ncbi:MULTISPECIES: hypothetical protein [Legionella]|nr:MULTISPECIES: hypothetical protein [Legionella]
MIRYCFDLLFTNSEISVHEMHEWLSSPAGIAIGIVTAASLISFALLATHFDKQDKNALKRLITTLWPYLRDSLKSLRNALRGVTSTLTLIFLLDLADIRHLIMPLGLLIGILSILNRIWFRYKTNHQNELHDNNKNLLAEIRSLSELSLEEIELIRSQIQKSSTQLKTLSFLSSVLCGLIDGINPYIGVLALGMLTPHALTFITIFCLVYLIATLTIRIYDEINLQNKLKISQKKIEFALLEKEINGLITRLSELEQEIYREADNPLLSDEYLRLLYYLDHKLREQEKGLDNSFLKKDIFIFCQGVKSGLNIYKYIMLTISFIIFLSPLKIPSVKPINRAIIGTVALTGGIIYFLSTLSVKMRINTEKKSDQSCVDSNVGKTTNYNSTHWKKTNSELKQSNLFFSSPQKSECIQIPTLKGIYCN